jgi:hypothetical protein
MDPEIGPWMELDVHDPWHNVREACKEALLLERHLFHRSQFCEDCVTKHLLTMEALLEEAVTLDTTGKMCDVLQALIQRIWLLQVMYVQGVGDSASLGQAVRRWRKRVAIRCLMPKFNITSSAAKVKRIREEGGRNRYFKRVDNGQ